MEYASKVSVIQKCVADTINKMTRNPDAISFFHARTTAQMQILPQMSCNNVLKGIADIEFITVFGLR